MNSVVHPPLAIIAELTHRCPLRCVYCSNPLQLARKNEELDCAGWIACIQQAAELGALQISFTGGEPLLRGDLAELIGAARASGLYVNLITSGIGLDEKRLNELIAAGVDHIQLSIQDTSEPNADSIAGVRAHQQKLRAARLIAQCGVAFTVNVVVHRRNIERVEEFIALAEEIGAQRLEIANVQYYGWALLNRAALLPTRSQVQRSVEVIRAAQRRLAGKLRIEHVLPDYFAVRPKPCMGGWANKMLLITPLGTALPCHAASILPGLTFPTVREQWLRWIWHESPAFQSFRGEQWMHSPCSTCPQRAQDFGGCRCQAFLLTGHAENTDPVCSLSPHHAIVEQLTDAVELQESGEAAQRFTYRQLGFPRLGGSI